MQKKFSKKNFKKKFFFAKIFLQKIFFAKTFLQKIFFAKTFFTKNFYKKSFQRYFDKNIVHTKNFFRKRKFFTKTSQPKRIKNCFLHKKIQITKISKTNIRFEFLNLKSPFAKLYTK